VLCQLRVAHKGVLQQVLRRGAQRWILRAQARGALVSSSTCIGACHFSAC
jgi:hypothetical protein